MLRKYKKHLFFGGVLLIVAWLGGLAVSCQKGERSIRVFEKVKGPFFMLVYYLNYPDCSSSHVHIELIKLSDVQSEQQLRNKKCKMGFPVLHAIGDEKTYCLFYDLIRKEKDKDAITLRIQKNGIVNIYDVVYSGEEYLPIAAGDKWYCAIIESIERKEALP